MDDRLARSIRWRQRYRRGCRTAPARALQQRGWFGVPRGRTRGVPRQLVLLIERRDARAGRRPRDLAGRRGTTRSPALKVSSLQTGDRSIAVERFQFPQERTFSTLIEHRFNGGFLAGRRPTFPHPKAGPAGLQSARCPVRAQAARSRRVPAAPAIVGTGTRHVVGPGWPASRRPARRPLGGRQARRWTKRLRRAPSGVFVDAPAESVYGRSPRESVSAVVALMVRVPTGSEGASGMRLRCV